MAKAVQFYAVVRNMWGSDYEIIAVTSEAHKNIYGRTVPSDEMTHRRSVDVLYRFKTEADALGAPERASKARRAFDNPLKYARSAVSAIEDDRDAAVLRAIKNEDKPVEETANEKHL